MTATPTEAKSAGSIAGVVAIGRNEGARLELCLASALAATTQVVYVDSGSTDGSVELAQKLGVATVQLDAAQPFTAARARNAGFERLAAIAPELQWVQFIDGDCQLDPGWLELARQSLEAHPDVGAVCGRRRERFPEASMYNRLCDVEWNTPVGEAAWCGGDSLVRSAAFVQAGQFNATMIAGEEPEFCLRLQKHGWRILRLDAEMTLHDAAITRFGQWWKRALRCGYAFAHGACLHGRSPQRFCVRETRSVWFWAIMVPVTALALVWPTHFWSLALFLAYPLKAAQLFVGARGRGLSSRLALQYAVFCLLGKFPQALGQIKFHVGRVLGRSSRIIEYKP
jgi:glycosyltransferase involved in cell wall biosynthesis